MATYRFEEMSQTEATGYTSGDTLVFSSATLLPSQVSITEGATTTALTAGGKTLIFAQDDLYQTTIQFTSSFQAGSDATLAVGTSGDDAAVTLTGSSNGSYAYGLTGDDTVTGGTGADNIFGGAGVDSLTGGAGNDHIYGYGLDGDPSTDDGDVINGGAGNDYVQGNAGDDTIDGGSENDRLNGGAGADSIVGGAGIDVINGNKGEDTIDGGLGNDNVRGGQDDDVISGGAGNDIVQGDLGDDSLTGGTGLDVLTGGSGADHFVFAAGDASYTLSAGATQYLTDIVTDLASGDKLEIGLTLTDIAFQSTGVTFSTFAAAETYAQGLYDTGGNVNTVAYAMQVGSDTYLFYDTNAAGTDLNSAIKLVGIDADTFFDPDAPNGRFA